MLLPHLTGTVIERVERAGAGVWIWARADADGASCWSCGTPARRVHSRYERTLADVPVAGQPVVLRLRVRRFFCEQRACSVQTFAEQVEGLTTRYARRTPGCREALERIGLALAGRAGARLAGWVGMPASRGTVLGLVHALPDPAVEPETVLGVDDFALARRQRYATVVIDAVSHRRIDVLPDRRADSVASWLRRHPGVDVVCRDGSASYAEAIRQGAPQAVQVSDRWHLWHNLTAAVEKVVISHTSCWKSLLHTGTSVLVERTRERFHAVHALLDEGAGLLECARRLGWALNTVKRYARADSVQELLRPPRYGRCLVDDYRDLVRRRLAEQVPVTRILAEIRQHGYTGSHNLLVRYINQGRADPKRATPSPRQFVTWIMSKPENLPGHHRRHRDDLIASCPALTTLTTRVREFAEILTRRRGTDLDSWISAVRNDDLPALDAFTDGLSKDYAAVVAGLTLPYSNGPTEGVINKIKMLKRQTYGKASFPLLRKRILLMD